MLDKYKVLFIGRNDTLTLSLVEELGTPPPQKKKMVSRLWDYTACDGDLRNIFVGITPKSTLTWSSSTY